MADFYDAEGIDREEGEESWKENYEPFKENVIFLIDAEAAMLRPADLQAPDFEGDSWVDVAIKVARSVTKQRIIASANDQLAIIFYGARNTENEHAFEGIYVYQDLSIPDAERINDLLELPGAKFRDTIGSAKTSKPDYVRYGLWTASQMLATAGAKATKRIMLFTNDPDPTRHSAEHVQTYREQIAGRAADLRDTGVAVELFPMVPESGSFPMDFWRDMLKLEEEQLYAYEGAEVYYRIWNMTGVVKHKSFRKRTLGSLRWMFPGGFEIAVNLYGLFQTATIGAAQWLKAQTNEPLRPDTALINDDTGGVVTDVQKVMFPNPKDAKLKNARFPIIVLDNDELRELKQVRSPGLRLLGFKPRSSLKDTHQLRPSTFLYPDERSLQGSTTAFIAFWEVMRSSQRLALCSFVRNKTSEPRLVALLAAEEVLDEAGNQLEPPGMHMIYLPYSDDIRNPETDPNFVGDAFFPAEEPEIAAAEEMVKALTAPVFEAGSTPNPYIQRHYQVLELFALGQKEEPPPPEDLTLPDPETMQGVSHVIQAFKDLVYGPGYELDLMDAKALKEAAAASRKRKNPEQEAAITAAAGAHDFKALAAENNLGRLTVNDLKAYLDVHKLPKSGTKAVLIQRIMKDLGY